MNNERAVAAAAATTADEGDGGSGGNDGSEDGDGAAKVGSARHHMNVANHHTRVLTSTAADHVNQETEEWVHAELWHFMYLVAVVAFVVLSAIQGVAFLREQTQVLL